MGAVYHIFIPCGPESWTWAATVPAPLTYEQARRLVAALRSDTPAGPLRIIPVEDAPHPVPLFRMDEKSGK